MAYFNGKKILFAKGDKGDPGESAHGIIFDEFPSEDEIIQMPNKTYFTVRFNGYVNEHIDTELVTYYRTTSWRANSIRYKDAESNTVYVVPMNQKDGEVFMPYYGIKQGKGNAENNSNIIESMLDESQWGVAYGCTFKFPVGHFYFSRPINIPDTNHISIIGAVNAGFRNNVINGTTWLHFENLSEGETALTVSQCTIADFTIAGSSEQYNFVLNRCDTTDTTQKSILNGDKPEVVETVSVEAFGIKAVGNMIIRDIGVKNFYHGIWCETSNMNITNIAFNNCHYGLSVGCDIKMSNIFGFNLATLLQLRGSLASVTGVRGDSIGNHLVEITGGGNHTLTDLDADFCMNSIVAIGDGINTSNISDLIINGVHGRSGVSHVYANSGEEVNATHITIDTANEYGVICVNKGSSLKGAIITTNQRFGSNNPFDYVSGYNVPYVLLSAGEATTVEDIHFVCSAYNINDNNIDEDWVAKRVASCSSLTNACSVKVDTSKGYIKYSKSNNVVTIVDDASDIYNRMDKSNLALDGEVVKTVNGLYPDENGNVDVVQEEPEFVNSIEECVDTSKRYVLPDGYIYSYKKKFIPGSTTPNFTNQLPISIDPSTNEVLNGVGYKTGYRYVANTSGEIVESELQTEFADHSTTGLIPIEEGQTIRINQIGYNSGCGAPVPLICFIAEAESANFPLCAGTNSNLNLITEGGGSYTQTGTWDNTVWSDIVVPLNETTGGWVYRHCDIKYFTVCFSPKIPQEDIIITVDEEITYTVTEDHYEWNWENTGELYDEPDYSSMIDGLESRVTELENNSSAGNEWRKIAEITLAGATDKIEITTDADGHKFKLNKVMLSMALHFNDAPSPFFIQMNGCDFMQIKTCANFNTDINRYMNFYAERTGEGAFGYAGITSVASSLAHTGYGAENETRHAATPAGFYSGIDSIALECIKGNAGDVPTVDTQMDAGKTFSYRNVTNIEEEIDYTETIATNVTAHSPIVPGSISFVYEDITYHDKADGTTGYFYNDQGEMYMPNWYDDEGNPTGSDFYVEYDIGLVELPEPDLSISYKCYESVGVNIKYTAGYSGYMPYRYNVNMGGISEQGLKLKFNNYKINTTNTSLFGYGQLVIILSGATGKDETTKTKKFVPFLLLDTVNGTLSLASENDISWGGYTVHQEIIKSDLLKYENIGGKRFDIVIKDNAVLDRLINRPYNVSVVVDESQEVSGILDSYYLFGLQYHPKINACYTSIGGVDNLGNNANNWSIDFLGFENQEYGSFSAGGYDATQGKTVDGCKITVWGQDM